MKSVKSIINNLGSAPKEKNKYVSQEFQDYGLYLATRLNDTKFKSMYIKLAKENNRALLEQAFSFAIDYPNAKNKGKIFLWKLSELKKQQKEKPSSPKAEGLKKTQ